MDFKNLISDVQFAKASTIDLDDTTLENITATIAEKISEYWIALTQYTYKDKVNKTDFLTWEVQSKPAIHSFYTWRGFINISSNWTAFYKNNDRLVKLATFWTWEIKYSAEASPILQDILEWQTKNKLMKG